MEISENKLAQVVKTAIDSMQEYLLKDISQRIDGAMAAYRKSVTVKEHWCCREMREFAAHFWNASKPCIDNNTFGVAYQIRGSHVNFCPFCGVKIGT
jgi:hypothetical protein